VLGGPAVSASFALAANFDATKLPVAPLSTSTTAGREPTNPASLMSALLGGAALRTVVIGPLATGPECRPFRGLCSGTRGAERPGGASPMPLSSEATDDSR
jgi:hypothetical protein